MTALAFLLEASRVQIATDSLAHDVNGAPAFMTSKVFWLDLPAIAVTGRGEMSYIKDCASALAQLPPTISGNVIHHLIEPRMKAFHQRIDAGLSLQSSVAVFYFDLVLNRYCCLWYRSPRNGGFTVLTRDIVAFMPGYADHDYWSDVAASGFGPAAAAWIREAWQIETTMPIDQRSHIGGAIELHTLENGIFHRSQVLAQLA